MSSVEQSRQERIDQIVARSWGGAAGLFGGLFAALGAGLRGLGEQRAAAAPASGPAAPASEILARAIADDSSRAMDWLFYASQLRDPAERRYCVTRALQIDPSDALVLAEARRLR